MMEEALTEARQRMQKAVEHLKDEFGTIRTGRAMPSVVEKIRADYYGSEVPLQQLASFSVPEPRILVVSPFDKGDGCHRKGDPIVGPWRDAEQ